MEFDFQRFVRCKAGGNSLVEPEPYLLLIFWVLWRWLLLCSNRDRQKAAKQHRKSERYAPRYCVLALETSTYCLVNTTPSLIDT